MKGLVFPYLSYTAIGGSYMSQMSIYDSTMIFVLPAAESTPCDHAPAALPRGYGIIPIYVNMQEEYLNLHARYCTESSVHAALTEVQQD